MAISAENIKRKVRGLMAMAADGSGATPAEKDTARRLAAALLARHAVSEADVQESPARRVPEHASSPGRAPIFTVNINGTAHAFGVFFTRDLEDDYTWIQPTNTAGDF